MTDPPPARTHILAALAACAAPGDAVTLSIPPPSARLNLRVAAADTPALGAAAADAPALGAAAADTAALGAAMGIVLGTTFCSATVSADRVALRLGPDEWLLLAPDGAAPALIAAAAGHPASVVDVSHQSTAIAIAGRFATHTLNAFCALDLAEAAFPVGMCTRTLLGKAEIMLWRTAPDGFHIEVGRSFAPYVWRCLEEGRFEFLEL